MPEVSSWNPATVSALVSIDRNGAVGGQLAVKLERIVADLDVEGFFFAVKFEVVWYSP
jgi:hypothetical protein